MGLDAIVYRHKTSLPFDPDSVGAVLDESTGEYYFPDPMLESARERQFPRETRIAAEKRLGNVSLVRALRQEIEQVLSRDSIIVSKVLYSGTHAGDSIPLDLIPALENELLRLHGYANEKDSVRVKQFVIGMTDLATAARREANPIVF